MFKQKLLKLDFVLISILLTGCFLRFYGLTRESLWVDELITMREVDPLISWGKMFEFLSIADPHPPLFFILERLMCSFFGHSESVLRGFNALLGTVSILFIYQLGREILDKKLGYIAAILLCINYYSIVYSQEGRDYALALCNSVLATLFFVRFLKNPSYKRGLSYAFFALLLLYTHYFGLFVIGSHGALVLLLMITEKGLFQSTYRYYLISALAIFLGYVPWLPSFFKQLGVTSFWIPPIPEDFATSYFFEYFGNATIIQPLLVLLLLFYCGNVFLGYNQKTDKKITENPLQLSFLVIGFIVFATFFVPYLRSLWVVPMLLARYTIVLVPLFIVAIAYGVVLIKSPYVQGFVLVSFVLLSSIHIVFIKNFYSPNTVAKTQFREATLFMKETGGAYPLIESSATIWPHGYYLDRNGYHLPTFWGIDKVDSVLSGRFLRYQVDGFWLFGALPDETRLSANVQSSVDSLFTLVQSKTFFQSWVQLYVRKTGSWNTVFISPFDFDKPVFRQSFDVVAKLEDRLQSKRVLLKPGRYKLLVEQSGEKVNDQLPQISVYRAKKKLGEFTGYEYPFYGEKQISFTVDSESNEAIHFQIDGPSNKGKVYVRFVRIIPMSNQ